MTNPKNQIQNNKFLRGGILPSRVFYLKIRYYPQIKFNHFEIIYRGKNNFANFKKIGVIINEKISCNY